VGSGWHHAETAKHPQNMKKFAAWSLGAVTAHRINWILLGRSEVEQMRQWQQALQAEQIIDAGPKRVSPLSALQITETKEGGVMVITTTRITQMHDIVQTALKRSFGAKARGWERSLRKHGEINMKYRATRPLQHVVMINVEAKTSVC